MCVYNYYIAQHMMYSFILNGINFVMLCVLIYTGSQTRFCARAALDAKGTEAGTNTTHSENIHSHVLAKNNYAKLLYSTNDEPLHNT